MRGDAYSGGGNRVRRIVGMGIGRCHVHALDHATVDELKRFVAAFPQARIVPIHLEDRDGFAELSSNVEPKHDYEWWEV